MRSSPLSPCLSLCYNKVENIRLSGGLEPEHRGQFVSDITKKIFSIEQTEGEPVRSDAPKSSLIRPLADEPAGHGKPQTPEKVPEFVTRDMIKPLATPPAAHAEDIKTSGAGGWVIIGFGVLYAIGAGLYFGLPLLQQPMGVLPLVGLGVLVALPLFLLFLLWRSLRHLRIVSQQNARFSKAAEILVSPDREALARTETLAEGIRGQIAKVNSDVSQTVQVLKSVQTAVSQESEALDTAGQALSKRSDDVGQNLTLQRQALESLSSNIDARMSALATQITDKGQALDEICTAAEIKILGAGDTLKNATAEVDESATSSAVHIGEQIFALEETSRKLAETAENFTAEMGNSTETLLETDKYFAEYSDKFQSLNAETQSQFAEFQGLNVETQSRITELQATIGQGYQMLDNLKANSETRAADVASYYDNLSNQLKRSEDDTLVAQGETARMVEANLAQMRREFSRMETDLQSLQLKLNRLRDNSDDLEHLEPASPRLKLKPLESDFPPVEPPRTAVRAERVEIADSPLNLGMEMEIESADDPLINFEPDVVRRPGDTGAKPKSKGFGQRSDKNEKSGWRWRDMLGTLERPDGGVGQTAPASSLDAPSRKVDGVALLTALKLSPSAIVDEGTVVDATQARINSGEPGLTSVVKEKLPEAVAHLKENLATDTVLKADLQAFTVEFSQMIGNTPPTAPALRAAFGSPEGRAYLLCAAAFRPELR